MTYKLTYFDLPGLAETIRMIFTYGNVPFEDKRISYHDKTEWAALKKTMAFEQIPVLEYKGKVANQSMAIARYAGKQVKLAGNSDWENLEIDAVADNVNDLRTKAVAPIMEKDEAKKKALCETLTKETFPFYLERLNKSATKEGLVLGRLTWADFFFSCSMESIQMYVDPDVIKPYPNLVAIQNKILNIPSVKAYVAKHPRVKTNF